jgi:hypothetical protein
MAPCSSFTRPYRRCVPQGDFCGEDRGREKERVHEWKRERKRENGLLLSLVAWVEPVTQ